jgi:RNA polymerase sigma factor (sigma-70 family)
MASEHSVTNWLAGLKAGDQKAAQRVWERYFEKLVQLAGKKLPRARRRVADEEDVVVEAFASFCRAAQAGKFPRLDDRADLWQLLVMLTARKAADHIQHEHRQKRGGGQVRGESVFLQQDAAAADAGLGQFVGQEPTPQFAAQVAEELQRFLDALGDDTLRHIARCKLENYSHQEIAAQLGVSEETIRRKLNRIKLTLANLLAT